VRYLTVLFVAVGAAACVGCIASERIEPGDLDRWAALHQDPSAVGPCECPMVAGRRLPKRWVFRHHPSLIWSALSIVRAADRLQEGAEEVEVLVSPEHAVALADLMARGRTALEEARDVCTFDEPVDRDRWARGLASALTGLEGVVRASAADPTDPAGARRGQEPLGASAAPVLDMLIQYLNQRTGGALLADLPPEDLHRVRAILVQTVLRVGFAAAGRRPTDALREGVVEEMQTAETPEDAKPALAEMLGRAVEQAPPASAGGGGLAGPVRAVLSYAPKALQALEMLARQWDCMDHVAFEFHRCGDPPGAGPDAGPIVTATLAVRRGQEVRLEDMVMFQPVLAFRGTTRIVVEPELAPTGETVVALEPVAGTEDEKGEGEEAGGPEDGGGAPGAVEMRFEGLAWGLAKLFALPLSDGRLREVRVFVGQPGEADRIVNVALVMEARGAKGDPRRLLHFQDVRRRRIERGPFEIRTVTERTEQVFNYLTPEKRYTFTRVKTAEE